jgi:CheY-like chemotaxis protein
MKPLSGLSIVCICLIFISLTGVVAVDSAQYDKCVNIYMNIDNGKITTKSTEIFYGAAPQLFPTNEGFKAELVTADGSTVKTFNVWDPRIQFGDRIAGNADNLQIEGIVDSQSSADFVVTFPFDPKITGFRLYDPDKGTLIASMDLKPQIDSFFASYPYDPDNPASYGSMETVIANNPQAGRPDPVAQSSGYLLGILTMGSGVVLLLMGVFASARFLKKRQQSVLIVDDNRDIMDVIADLLRMGGYVPRTANSGEECLRELASAIPSLILLDIGMEPMDGWETLRRIKNNPATKDIPVIMLTALKLTPKDVEDYGICIEDYVVKPVSSQDLNDAIAHVFARRQMIKEKIAAAMGAGIGRNELCECARLTRVVDVNKRLWNLLVKTYRPEMGMDSSENEITLAIKNTEKKIHDQERQLEQITHKIFPGVSS